MTENGCPARRSSMVTGHPSRSPVFGPRSSVPGLRSPVPGLRSPVFGPRSPVFGPRSSVPGPRSSVPGPRSPVPGPRSSVPGPRSSPSPPSSLSPQKLRASRCKSDRPTKAPAFCEQRSWNPPRMREVMPGPYRAERARKNL